MAAFGTFNAVILGVATACALVIHGSKPAVAQRDVSNVVQAWRNVGWPGGDAEMSCKVEAKRIPGVRAVVKRGFILVIENGRIGVLSDRQWLKLDATKGVLTPTGFIVESNWLGVAFGPKFTFHADFKAETLTITADSIARIPNADIGAAVFECQVAFGPVFEDAEEETSHADILRDRLREIGRRHAPAPVLAADAPLARDEAGVRDAAEEARDLAAAGVRLSLRTMPWFTESAAGRDYARSPNGRAIAVGLPRERCIALGMAKETLNYSALAAAYGACVAELPPEGDADAEPPCACAAAIVGNVLLQDPSAFDYEPRPGVLLATAAEDGSGLRVMQGVLTGDPDDPAGLRIDDADGREICAGLKTTGAPFELRCIRFGARYAARAELLGRRGMRGFGAALGFEESKRAGEPLRTLALFFSFGDAALTPLTGDLREIWAE